MHDGLQRRFEQAFADCVDDLYREYRIETYCRGTDWIKEPVTGLFHRTSDAKAAATLKELARRALAARGHHLTHGPPWSQPLPLAWDDLCQLVGVGGRRELVGNYAASLLGVKWDFQRHAPFHQFCCGVMADRGTPGHLRNDPMLIAEFPPKELPGLMSAEEAAILDHVEYRLRAKAAKGSSTGM
jgi:hypothetical protein